jgi:hypothetical protein
MSLFHFQLSFLEIGLQIDHGILMSEVDPFDSCYLIIAQSEFLLATEYPTMAAETAFPELAAITMTTRPRRFTSEAMLSQGSRAHPGDKHDNDC